MLNNITIVALAVLLIILTGVLFGQSIDSRQPIDIETPEAVWIPQALYVRECGRTLGIIITTEPMQFASEAHPGTPEMAALVSAARDADLAYAFNIKCET